jgi:hypothetical protein
MVQGVRLSGAFRTGALTGVAAGRLVHVLARSTPDQVAAWEKQLELSPRRLTKFTGVRKSNWLENRRARLRQARVYLRVRLDLRPGRA